MLGIWLSYHLSTRSLRLSRDSLAETMRRDLFAELVATYNERIAFLEAQNDACQATVRRLEASIAVTEAALKAAQAETERIRVQLEQLLHNRN